MGGRIPAVSIRRGTLLRRLSLGFFLVAIAEATGLWIATFWALSDLSRLSTQLVEITRSLDATRDLSRELGRLLFYSQRMDRDPQATAEIRVSIASVSSKLESCASSTCHGARRNPKEMVASIAPDFAQLVARFQPLTQAQVAPELIGGWRSDSLQVIGDTEEKISRMSAALLERVEDLRKASDQVPGRAKRNFLLLITAGIGLAWAAASFSASRLLQPLAFLLSAIRSVGKGQLPHNVEVRGPEEIQELAHSFNDMVARLQRYRADLEEANRTLERRVQERTEELKRSQEVLYRSEKLASLGLLTGGIAHEINNPLTGISMNVDLLMEEETEGSMRWRELLKISEDVQRCKQVIDDFREFSRERAFSRTAVDLMHLVHRTLRLSDVLLQKKGIKVHCNDPEGLVVKCDPGRIQQVFTNIVLNAVDATPQGGNLKITGAAKNGCAMVSFRDNGCGIPKESLSRVFDPFFTTKPQGTGLGLSICYGIVSEHGGSIEIESQSGRIPEERGTTVSISLPLEEGCAEGEK